LFRRPADFVIGDPADPYMLRWWVIPRNRWFNIYLHKIRRPDDDRALHDHPWWNLSFVLKGGYTEVTPCSLCGDPNCAIPVRRWRGLGSLVLRRAAAAHRLELAEDTVWASAFKVDKRYRPAWTLFITGPRFREWGFWCRKGWVVWTDFVDKTNTGSVGRGCGEHGG
jgi:hypothetical protein